jgi:hypothetical protein
VPVASARVPATGPPRLKMTVAVKCFRDWRNSAFCAAVSEWKAASWSRALATLLKIFAV